MSNGIFLIIPKGMLLAQQNWSIEEKVVAKNGVIHMSDT